MSAESAHVAVVLAAGGSRRLGRPKQLLTRAGETLVHRAARLALETSPSRVLVVTGSHAASVESAIADLIASGVECLRNPQWNEGMASSLRRAALALFSDSLPCVSDSLPCSQGRVGEGFEPHCGELGAIAPHTPSQPPPASRGRSKSESPTAEQVSSDSLCMPDSLPCSQGRVGEGFEPQRGELGAARLTTPSQPASRGRSKSERAVLILGCDQPGLDTHHLHALLRGSKQSSVASAATIHGERLGAPAVVPLSLLQSARHFGGDRGLGAQLTALKGVWALHAPELALDIDTTQDVAEAVKRDWLDPVR